MTHKALREKRALVTGASGDLGKEIVTALKKYGCVVYATSRSLDGFNLTKVEDINGLLFEAAGLVGKINILINCAGETLNKPTTKNILEDYEAIFNLNVRAPFLLCKALIPGMVKRGWGRIVNIGSSSAYQGFKNTALYCASKHALLGMSRALNEEFKEYNVRTFCVSPAAMKTRVGAKLTGQDYDTFLNPKEVAEYICFIISFDAELISEEVRLNRWRRSE